MLKYHHHHHPTIKCFNCNGYVSLCEGMNDNSKIVEIFLSWLPSTLEERSLTSQMLKYARSDSLMKVREAQ